MARPDHFLSPLLKKSAGAHELRASRVDEPVAVRLLTAFDSASRRRGLLGRTHLDEGEALIIAPCSAVHTFGMQFPIDLVYAARDGRVLRVCHAVPARRVSAAWGAFAVIELPSGCAGRLGLARGETLYVEPRRGARVDPTPT